MRLLINLAAVVLIVLAIGPSPAYAAAAPAPASATPAASAAGAASAATHESSSTPSSRATLLSRSLPSLPSLPLLPSTPTWRWPLPAPHAVARQYIAPANPYGQGHRGIDLSAAGRGESEEVVTSPASGIVHYVGFVVDRPVVSIDHGSGVLSSFEPVASTLEKGQRVNAGQSIGTLQPGHCTVPCLHLGARVNGEYVSPLLFLGGIPRAVLLPTRRSG
jgi:murein DD-endopeptidase MepM/ murein hydrolase activator NlpD